MIGIETGVFQSDGKFALDLMSIHESGSEDTPSLRNKPTILVVDDHRIIADSLADILNESGFRAVAAYDGGEASRIAADIQPDYLLTDVVMPVMNGVELAIHVTKSSPGTRILLLSGQAGIADMLREGRQQGYQFQLIGKPIHPEKLIQLIRNL